MIDLALIAVCAPNVAPATIQAIIKVESGGNPLAVNVNKRGGVSYPIPKIIKSTGEAVRAAYAAIEAGHTVDMGYMQINSANLPRLGYTVADAFNPCKNLAGGAQIYTEAYATSLAKHGNEQKALREALSVYNTGNTKGGFKNGYVQRYMDGKPGKPRINPYTAGTSVFFINHKENDHE